MGIQGTATNPFMASTSKSAPWTKPLPWRRAIALPAADLTEGPVANERIPMTKVNPEIVFIASEARPV